MHGTMRVGIDVGDVLSRKMGGRLDNHRWRAAETGAYPFLVMLVCAIGARNVYIISRTTRGSWWSEYRGKRVPAWVIAFLEDLGLFAMGVPRDNVAICSSCSGPDGKSVAARRFRLTHFIDDNLECLYAVSVEAGVINSIWPNQPCHWAINSIWPNQPSIPFGRFSHTSKEIKAGLPTKLVLFQTRLHWSDLPRDAPAGTRDQMRVNTAESFREVADMFKLLNTTAKSELWAALVNEGPPLNAPNLRKHLAWADDLSSREVDDDENADATKKKAVGRVFVVEESPTSTYSADVDEDDDDDDVEDAQPDAGRVDENAGPAPSTSAAPAPSSAAPAPSTSAAPAAQDTSAPPAMMRIAG